MFGMDFYNIFLYAIIKHITLSKIQKNIYLFLNFLIKTNIDNINNIETIFIIF